MLCLSMTGAAAPGVGAAAYDPNAAAAAAAAAAMYGRGSAPGNDSPNVVCLILTLQEHKKNIRRILSYIGCHAVRSHLLANQ